MSPKLIAELISEKDARSNDNDGAGSVLQQVASVLDHDDGLTTTSGDDHLTVTSGVQCIESAGLMGTECDQILVCLVDITSIQENP